jgi:naphthoate synthase
MSAARNPSRTAPPTPGRDGFELVSRAPITWDVDLTEAFEFQDILYHKSSSDRTAMIRFNRPEILNAFRPLTIREIQTALQDASDDPNVAVILLSSVVDPNHYTASFCAGGDQNVRGDGGYQDGTERAPKLRVLELQQQMRYCPKPIVAVVRGYAVGGGHILHLVSDLTLASESAVFGQTGPRMGSFDAGYGCVQAVATMGQKRARELWFLSRFYSAQEAKEMGMVNAVYGDDELDGRVAQWCRRMVMNSPTALAACKAACNAVSDGGAGIMQMGGQLTRLFYLSDESKEGRVAFLEKRAPDFRSKL